MRILIANDGASDVGGVQTYLDVVIDALEARGHSLGFAYCSDSGSPDVRASARRMPKFHVGGTSRSAILESISKWAPDVCYSHNMGDLDVDRALMRIGPVIKFMHGYFGTCIGGQKMHAFPRPLPCDRIFGPACAAMYLPRRCGRLNPRTLVEQWGWAERQHALLRDYAAIVVASDHMRREYVRNGSDPSRVYVNPLFPTEAPESAVPPLSGNPHVAFLGRMTALKGGDLLIRAVRHASLRLGHSIELTMIGDGPQRGDWEALARSLAVPCTFTGWVHGDQRWSLLREAWVVAIPSLWPEPFGLVGLEAGALGVPAVAINVGGVGQWLRNGTNGVAVEAPASSRSFGEALASVMADRPRLAELRAGALRVAREMTPANHVDRLESIFRRACSRALAS